MSTKIEYLDETINPIQTKIKGSSGLGYHCTKISEGCKNCWAESMNNRFGNHIPFDDRKMEYRLVHKELKKLSSWKKPRRIGIQYMGDLFHPDIPVELIDRVFDYMTNPMYGADHHTYLILTKRPERMLEFNYKNFAQPQWKHIWVGVTVENQKTADQRIPVLMQIPAAVRFVSVEPMLSELNMNIPFNSEYNINALTGDIFCGNQSALLKVNREMLKYVITHNPINWIICGGESGHGSRPMKPDWVRSLRDQCIEANIPFFFKQWGTYACEDGIYGSGMKELIKVGKKNSGHLLDGKEWHQYPVVK